MLFNLIEDRKEKVEKEEGTISDNDSKEETKGAEHILEVRRREDGLPPKDADEAVAATDPRDLR
jgi:hypothetical protein